MVASHANLFVPEHDALILAGMRTPGFFLVFFTLQLPLDPNEPTNLLQGHELHRTTQLAARS